MMKANDTILPSQTSNIALCLLGLWQEVCSSVALCRHLAVSHYDVEQERQASRSTELPRR